MDRNLGRLLWGLLICAACIIGAARLSASIKGIRPPRPAVASAGAATHPLVRGRRDAPAAEQPK